MKVSSRIPKDSYLVFRFVNEDAGSRLDKTFAIIEGVYTEKRQKTASLHIIYYGYDVEEGFFKTIEIVDRRKFESHARLALPYEVFLDADGKLLDDIPRTPYEKPSIKDAVVCRLKYRGASNCIGAGSLQALEAMW